MKYTYSEIHRQLVSLSTAEGRRTSEWFFKTEPGQYGHGDRFLGIKVPKLRTIAKKLSRVLSFYNSKALSSLLKSAFHEERALALMILVLQYEQSFKKGEKAVCLEIFELYLRNLKHVNNWDLVDISAPQIVGRTFFHFKPKKMNKLVQKWSCSSDLWLRRIAILQTLYFIKQGQLRMTYELAKRYLNDSEDLIHKATGWMLREAGKIDPAKLEIFLRLHAHPKTKRPAMPRTMLRYALEKFPEKTRKEVLAL